MGTEGNATGITTEIVQQNGGIVLELIVDSSNDPMSHVDAWVTAYSLNGSVMQDKDGVARSELSVMNADREWAFIVDLSNMAIVWRAFGSLGNLPNVEDYSAVQGLVEICTPKYLNCP